MKKSYLIGMIVGSIVVVLALILMITYFSLNSSVLKTDVDFVVKEGQSGYQVAYSLKEEGCIRSLFLFKLKIKLHQANFFTGTYELKRGYTTSQIFKTLKSGKVKMATFVFPEGAYLSQIAKKLSNEGWGSEAEFYQACDKLLFQLQKEGQISHNANSLQGFLYPDTYKLSVSSTMEQIVTAMIELFFQKTEDYRNAFSTELFYRKIILASIVEKEYRAEEEAPLIASVFKNRLQIRMPLQSCATIVYIIQEIQQKPHPERLYYKDLEIDNPFNTYKHYGLPPAPICSPSMIAINAVFNAPETDYLYFVVKDSEKGTHYFSNNLESHNRAKYNYLNRTFK